MPFHLLTSYWYFIHNIELKPGKGGELVRAAELLLRYSSEGKYVQFVRLNQVEVRMILELAVPQLVLSETNNGLVSLGKGT